ncbi:MAG: hypothetical protein KDC54_17385 [Lewinella sp.]|nr:hypothetical protein [Lewinella sp.]
MTRLQYGVIGGSVLLLLLLYLGCETTPPAQKRVERSRAATAQTTDINVLRAEAKESLNANALGNIQALEQRLSQAATDSLRIEALRELSRSWYQTGHPALAGYYAEELANISGTEEAWSITGTTFAICVQRATTDKVKAYCNEQAIRAFENAISLNPAEVAHRVNLAFTYTEMPPAGEPMKGVMMLRELQEAYPNSTLVLNSLARLAIQTGQWERATERLQQALAIEPDNQNTICLLAQAYAGLGDQAQAAAFAERCDR